MARMAHIGTVLDPCHVPHPSKWVLAHVRSAHGSRTLAPSSETYVVNPLRLTGVPVKGPTGAPDNLLRLQVALGQLLPRGTFASLAVEHDEGCPCVEDERGSLACTCEVVNVTLRTLVEAP